jgi:hypothetical protein
MKITKRQLKRIISEIGPPPDMNAPGWGPNDTQDWEWQARSEERRGIQDEYESWVKETGQITPAASSVMATFLLDTGLEDEHDLHQWLAGNYGMDHEDVMRDLNRQKKEYEAGGVLSDEELYQRSFKESNMKISRRQIRRMVRESWDDPLRPDDDTLSDDEFAPASRAHELLNKYEDGEISDKDFVYHIDTLARSANYVPLSQERIDASYTVEDYVNDLGHQLVGRL